MAGEPTDMVMELQKIMRRELLEVRDDVKGLKDDMRTVKVNQGSHTMQIDFLGERVEQLKEATLTSLGFSTSLNVQQQRMEKQIGDLLKRADKLEKAK